MHCIKLSNHGSHYDNIEIILQVQDYRLLWDKAQSDYKDHELKAVTWNNIRKSVELPGLCQFSYILSLDSVHI